MLLTGHFEEELLLGRYSQINIALEIDLESGDNYGRSENQVMELNRFIELFPYLGFSRQKQKTNAPDAFKLISC